jgi:ABC-type Fe3+ transport system substrate-binding protein
VFPRKFRFEKNGSPLVASYVALVSSQVLPDELAYWIKYMSSEDKELVYLGVVDDG